jgi:diacylglycerol kinase family enzyme
MKSHDLSGNVDGFSFNASAIFFGAALGCCFGKRIVIAPAASPVRNRFGLVWAGPVRFLGLLHLVFLAYFGALHRSAQVNTAGAGRVSLDSTPSAWIEADGELIGKTPVEIVVIPGAFSFAAKAAGRTADVCTGAKTGSPHDFDRCPFRGNYAFISRKICRLLSV